MPIACKIARNQGRDGLAQLIMVFSTIGLCFRPGRYQSGQTWRRSPRPGPASNGFATNGLCFRPGRCGSIRVRRRTRPGPAIIMVFRRTGCVSDPAGVNPDRPGEDPPGQGQLIMVFRRTGCVSDPAGAAASGSSGGPGQNQLIMVFDERAVFQTRQVRHHPSPTPEMTVEAMTRATSKSASTSLVLFHGSPNRIYRPVSRPSLNNSY